ncbi:hypothetical protein WAF17_22355 (plasmid) [Bernardetia sp. ABR2-2B]|uniref:hypothetical protein n=1 Tax=Bernardetia sp. ABR2-2B TaxID=3127472 RepID=UPI0030D32164
MKRYILFFLILCTSTSYSLAQCPTEPIEIGVPNNNIESVQAKTLTASGRAIIDAINETLKKDQGTALHVPTYNNQGAGPSYTKYTWHDKYSSSSITACPPNEKVPASLTYYTNAANFENYIALRWTPNQPSTFQLYNYAPPTDSNFYLCSGLGNQSYRIYIGGASIHSINKIDYSNTIVDQDEPNFNDPWLNIHDIPNGINYQYNDLYGLPYEFETNNGNIIGSLKGNTADNGSYYNFLYWKEQITVRRILICQGESVTLTAPSGGTNYQWSNGETTEQISATDEGMYSFSYEQGGCIINSDVVYIKYDDCVVTTPPCSSTDTTTLTFPAYQLKEVINTSAQTLSDNWLLSKDIPLLTTTGERVNELSVRPYMVGKQGIWRGESSFAYVTDRKQTQANVNLSKDGTYTLNMFNWKYLGELDCPEWRKVETVSEYHPQSSDVERYNILKLYSSFHIGYSDQLVSAAAANSKQYEFGFEGFEEYTTGIESANANLLFATQTTVDSLKIPYWFTLETGRNRRIWSPLELQTLQNQYAFSQLHILGKQIDVNYPGEFRSHTTFDEITVENDKSLIKFSLNEDAPFEGFWTGKVGITVDKIATQVFSGTAPQVVNGIAHTGTKSLKVTASAGFEQPYLLLIPNKKYVISAWVRVDEANKPIRRPSYEAFTNLQIELGNGTSLQFRPEGQIIEGWQRIEGSFTVPEEGMGDWKIHLVTLGAPVYFDDIRLFPSLGNMESFVYDTETFRLEAKLDANNYATFYYYDAEGRLYLVKQETAKGVQTLQTVTTHTKRN